MRLRARAGLRQGRRLRPAVAALAALLWLGLSPAQLVLGGGSGVEQPGIGFGRGRNPGGSLLWAQESSQVGIDDLFHEPVEEEGAEADDAAGSAASAASEGEDEGAAEEEAAQAPQQEAVDLDELTTSPLKVSGKVSAGIGAGAGLIEWPYTGAADGRSVEELMRYSGFYSTKASVSLDARPEPYLRFYSSIETSLETDEGADNFLQMKDPYIKEFFIDYTLNDTVFFRVGRQALTWGHGRLLSNPANLVDRVSEGTAFRSTFPAGPGTMNGVIYIKSDWIGAPYQEIYDPRAFAYAGQYEAGLGPLSLALSGHFKMYDDDEEDIGGAATASFGLGPFDIAADFTGHWSRDFETTAAWAPGDWQAMGQIFWENKSRSLSLLGEYEFDSAVAGGRGHYGAVALRFPKIGGSSWRPALRWKHAFQDHSGEVVAAVDGTIAPKMKLSVGLPLIYGAPDSYYRAALTEQVDSDNDGLEDEEELIPIDNVLSLLLSLRLNFQF